jgi:hypothetical protein
MILYNVTVSIDPTIEHEWLGWMRSTHIPDVMATGFFKESRLSRVHGEEEGGVTYAITYLCFSEDHFTMYQSTHAPRLQREHATRYEGRFAAFRTMLSVVEEFKSE